MRLSRIGLPARGGFCFKMLAGRRPASMAGAYSRDLRERVVAAVERDSMSCNQAALRFGVAVSTAVAWVNRFRRTGSVEPGQMGGHKPRTISGEHHGWLIERCQAADFTLRGLVAELASERGLQVDDRSVWEFVRSEGLSYKKAFWPANSTALTWRAAGCSGAITKRELIRRGWCSSMKPGPRPTWRPCAAGHHAAPGCWATSPMATGTP